jgi:hypothetical protein
MRFGSGTYATAFRRYPERLLKGYEVRMPVTVHYDPVRPGEAVLEPGRAGWEHAVGAATFFAFAAVVWQFVL